MKKIIIIGMLALLAAAAVFLPYRTWLEERMEGVFERKGFENVELSISSVGLKSAALENISFGGEEKLNLRNVVLEYSLSELWSRNLQNLSLAGVTLYINQDGEGWNVVGFENFKPGPDSTGFEIPVTQAHLAGIPFRNVKIEDSVLNATLNGGRAHIPLDLEWHKNSPSSLTYEGAQISAAMRNVEAMIGKITLEAKLGEDEKWTGPWTAEGVQFAGLPAPVPEMKGGGTVIATRSTVEIEGKIASADNLWQAEFKTHHDLKAPENSYVTIVKANMPWKEGRIATANLKVPFAGKDAIKVTLDVQNVSLQELMQSLTGDRVSGTGQVSGTVPLLIGRDGKVTVLPGNLKSTGPGMIALPSDAIPGNNEQIALVREILADLQYSNLSISIEKNDSGALNVLMMFEGNNPAVYEGKPVKLNVNFTGDVLEFIQQNILFLTNPEHLLQQGNDEEN